MYDHVTATVVDESIVTPSESPVPKRITYLVPLFASRGDRELNEVARITDLRRWYGNDVDNIDLYGQAGAIAVAGLSGGASLITCRLLPDDAKTASILLSAHVKPMVGIPQYERTANGGFALDAAGAKKPLMTTGATPTAIVADGLTIKVVAEVVADPTNVSGEVSQSADGWDVYPIGLFKFASPGKCGNDFGFSISIDSSRDRLLDDGRRYILTLSERDSDGLTSALDEDVYFAFNPEARDPSNNKIREVLDIVYPRKLSTGEKNPVLFTYFKNTYKTLTDRLFTTMSSGTVNDVDFLFGLNKAGYAYDKLIVDATTMDLTDLVIFMKGGNDGSLGLGNTVQYGSGSVLVTQAIIDATKKKLLIDFYNCDYNPRLLDRRICPAGFAFDCNYDADVKGAMIGLSKWREDIIRFIDLGFTKNAADAIAKYNGVASTIDAAGAWNIVVVPHAGTTTNLIDNKRVTATYEIARSMIEAYGNHGRFVTFAGYQVAKVQYMEFDWLAQLTKDDQIGKLKDIGLMFAQELDRSGTVAFMNYANQYNKQFSKMKQWRNGAIAGDAIRVAHSILIKYKYDPAGATVAVGSAQREMRDFFATGAYPDSVKVVTRCFQSKNDLKTENASCEIIFYFPGEIDGWSVTIRARREEDNAQGG